MSDTLLTFLISGITALIGLIIGDVYTRIKKNGKKARERKKKEHEEEIRKILKEEVTPLKEKITEANNRIKEIQDNDLDILKKANRDSLRYQLYRIYDTCIFYTTADSRYSEKELFDSYRKLDGNHDCQLRHDKFISLPHEEEYNYKNKKDKESK